MAFARIGNGLANQFGALFPRFTSQWERMGGGIWVCQNAWCTFRGDSATDPSLYNFEILDYKPIKIHSFMSLLQGLPVYNSKNFTEVNNNNGKPPTVLRPLYNTAPKPENGNWDFVISSN
jgi:hypothetical protein